MRCDEHLDANGEYVDNVFLNPGAALKIGPNDRVVLISSKELTADEIALPIDSLVGKYDAPLPVAFQGLGLALDESARKRKLTPAEKKHAAMQKKREQVYLLIAQTYTNTRPRTHTHTHTRVFVWD